MVEISDVKECAKEIKDKWTKQMQAGGLSTNSGKQTQKSTQKTAKTEIKEESSIGVPTVTKKERETKPRPKTVRTPNSRFRLTGKLLIF